MAGYLQILLLISSCYITMTTGSDDTGSTNSSIPVFSDPTKMEPSVLSQESGSTARFHCAASGAPEITWLKDGETIDGNERVKFKDHDTLVIKDTESSDNGKYTCILSNSAGSINYTYELNVTSSEVVYVPEPESPVNITVTLEPQVNDRDGNSSITSPGVARKGHVNYKLPLIIGFIVEGLIIVAFLTSIIVCVNRRERKAAKSQQTWI